MGGPPPTADRLPPIIHQIQPKWANSSIIPPLPLSLTDRALSASALPHFGTARIPPNEHHKVLILASREKRCETAARPADEACDSRRRPHGKAASGGTCGSAGNP